MSFFEESVWFNALVISCLPNNATHIQGARCFFLDCIHHERCSQQRVVNFLPGYAGYECNNPQPPNPFHAFNFIVHWNVYCLVCLLVIMCASGNLIYTCWVKESWPTQWKAPPLCQSVGNTLGCVSDGWSILKWQWKEVPQSLPQNGTQWNWLQSSSDHLNLLLIFLHFFFFACHISFPLLLFTAHFSLGWKPICKPLQVTVRV